MAPVRCRELGEFGRFFGGAIGLKSGSAGDLGAVSHLNTPRARYQARLVRSGTLSRCGMKGFAQFQRLPVQIWTCPLRAPPLGGAGSTDPWVRPTQRVCAGVLDVTPLCDGLALFRRSNTYVGLWQGRLWVPAKQIFDTGKWGDFLGRFFLPKREKRPLRATQDLVHSDCSEFETKQVYPAYVSV